MAVTVMMTMMTIVRMLMIVIMVMSDLTSESFPVTTLLPALSSQPCCVQVMQGWAGDEMERRLSKDWSKTLKDASLIAWDTVAQYLPSVNGFSKTQFTVIQPSSNQLWNILLPLKGALPLAAHPVSQ